MRVSTVREFRDNATGFLKWKEPVLITRRGKMAGVFFPSPAGTLSVDLNHELFRKLSAEIARQVRESGGTEKEILSDFAGVHGFHDLQIREKALLEDTAEAAMADVTQL